MIDIDVKTTGPIYDGKAVHVVDDYLDETTREISELAVNEIQARLGQVLEHPTGHYQSRVTTDRAHGDGAWMVSDRGAVYGPWLEGTSSRNSSTKFKGYSTFRRVRAWLEGKADDIAETNLPKHLEKMGGS